MNFRFLCIFIFSLFSLTSQAQVTGLVTDVDDQPLPFVNIYSENGRFGTTTNEEGQYFLKLSEPGEYDLVFQFLGFETLRKKVQIDNFPFELNVQLVPETTDLDEVTVNSKENPADKIIKKAIDNREENKAKIEQFTADYYSRGLWRIKNAPEKILGQDVGDLGGGLDSTRSGIVYLSETISEITFKAPDDFKEKILASKVSGNDNGFSLNSAKESEFSFYNNTIDLNAKIVSPIADYAFNYYDYKLEGVFYDSGQLINKILVTPKRPKDRVFNGYIYIVEDSWQIYAVELETTGEAIQVQPIETLTFTQNFKFSEEHGFWIKISQTVDFSFSMFGISGDGRFTAVYSNYNFDPDFDRNTFSREILSFAEAANKKDSLFWKNRRPVPLTTEELSDYLKKDSIQELRNSRKYMDSVDVVANKFSLGNLFFGYNYSNSFEKKNFYVSSPILGTHFNTVQGWNTTLNMGFRKNLDDNSGKYWRISTSFNYGFSEEKLRYAAEFQKKFNNFSKPILTIGAGVQTRQINSTEPITERANDVASLLYERNFLKLYEQKFVRVGYQQEIINGVTLYADASYQKRSPLFNTTNQTWNNREDVWYTSNNPLESRNNFSIAVPEHSIFKTTLTGKINFAQNYLSYPDGKYNEPNNKYPTLFLTIENGLGAKEVYNYAQFRTALVQDVSLGNKGTFSYNLKGGTFLNAENIAYVDHQHFQGNQTRTGTGNYLNSFNLLPYYAISTNNSYFEAHMEQDFKGWILGKMPLLNRLNYNLILGAHFLSTLENKPYSEYSVGIDNLLFGKYRFFRLDYVVSQFEGNTRSGFIVGIKLLSILE